MIQLFSRCLCLCHCLCICVPNSFLNSYYHKLSENVWVWGSRASRSEIYSDVTIAGQRQQGKIKLLSQWTMEGWDEHLIQRACAMVGDVDGADDDYSGLKFRCQMKIICWQGLQQLLHARSHRTPRVEHEGGSLRRGKRLQLCFLHQRKYCWRGRVCFGQRRQWKRAMLQCRSI